ncbi:MAG: hypothetical protein FWD47_12525 [Treponema sp.]|nr:hypothetical protein [Treponema sp.]
MKIIIYNKANHNLEPNDYLFAVKTINKTPNISLANYKHQGCDVLEFDDNRNGDIKYLTEIHPKKDYLLLWNAWRKNKATRSRNATDNSPLQLTPKANLVHASNSKITHSPQNVNNQKEDFIKERYPMTPDLKKALDQGTKALVKALYNSKL